MTLHANIYQIGVEHLLSYFGEAVGKGTLILSYYTRVPSAAGGTSSAKPRKSTTATGPDPPVAVQMPQANDGTRGELELPFEFDFMGSL